MKHIEFRTVTSSGKGVPGKIPSYLKNKIPKEMQQETCVEITAAEEILLQPRKKVERESP